MTPISSGNTTRVSVHSIGTEANSLSTNPSISADGRYITFISFATNLVSGDTNSTWDVFVHDLQTGTTMRVSVDSSGVDGNGFSGGPSISGDGRFVAFQSSATNLVTGDTNEKVDIFVHDMQTGTTERVSVHSSGVEGDSLSDGSSISADGRYVAFNSQATNLVPGDTNGTIDVFVHDRQTGTTTRVSVHSSGTQADGNGSSASSISGDGRYITFISDATNLVANDTNARGDIFVHD
ncbi:MAG TPA: hypothetical protein VN843_00440, partial [Anaerolineales bacterium]|nr:hypothetical protein [Anaerolineales bacterium]